MSAQHVFALVFFGCLFTSGITCHLGYNIIGIQTTKEGSYDLSCGQRALPICPKVCTWTDQTCEDYATHRHWNKTHLIVTNMTYSYPLKASGYPRDDTGPGRVKSLHRRCCLAENIEASKCTSVIWKTDQTKGKFDVLASANSALKCPTNNAYIRDIKQPGGDQRQYNLEICCLQYAKNHDARVACQAPKNGETQAGVDAALKIAFGVSLPLALGIGIPLSCLARSQEYPNTIVNCGSARIIEFAPKRDCCLACANQKGTCFWTPADSLFPGFLKDICFLCLGPNMGLYNYPGVSTFITRY